MERPDAAIGESFHVVSPAALTFRGYAEGMAAWYGVEAQLEFLPYGEWRAGVSERDAEVTLEAGPYVWTARFADGRMELQPGYPERPTVRVMTDPETLADVAGGHRSGVEAFLSGRLRVRGNLSLALRLDSLLNPTTAPARWPRWSAVEAGGIHSVYLEVGCRSVRQRDVDDVLRARLATVVARRARRNASAVRAVRDRAQIVGGPNHALREQEAGGELAVGAGRAHDDRKRSIVQPDLERLLGGRLIAPARALRASHLDDGDRPLRVWIHEPILQARAMMREDARDEAPA